MAADNALQRGFGAVRYDLGVDLALTLQEAKYNRLAISPTTALATNPMPTEVRFIDFYRALQWRFQFARISNACPNLQINTVDRPDRYPGQFCAAGCVKIQCKKPDNCLILGSLFLERWYYLFFINNISKL